MIEAVIFLAGAAVGALLNALCGGLVVSREVDARIAAARRLYGLDEEPATVVRLAQGSEK